MNRLKDLVFWIRTKFNLKNRNLPPFILNELRAESIVIDCGANVGFFTDKIVKYVDKVYLFEPDPLAHTELLKKYSDNEKIVIHNVGVAAYNGQMKFYKRIIDNGNSDIAMTVGTSSFADKSNINVNDSFEIGVINLVEFINKFSYVDLIKIDIEGGEIDVINSILDSDSTLGKIGYIFFETHENIPSLIEGISKLKNRIISMGLNKRIFYNWN